MKRWICFVAVACSALVFAFACITGNAPHGSDCTITGDSCNCTNATVSNVGNGVVCPVPSIAATSVCCSTYLYGQAASATCECHVPHAVCKVSKSGACACGELYPNEDAGATVPSCGPSSTQWTTCCNEFQFSGETCRCVVGDTLACFSPGDVRPSCEAGVGGSCALVNGDCVCDPKTSGSAKSCPTPPKTTCCRGVGTCTCTTTPCANGTKPVATCVAKDLEPDFVDAGCSSDKFPAARCSPVPH